MRRNILFICSGNISRSFFAEVLLKNEIQQRGLKNISVSSAGLYAYPDNPPDPKIVQYLLKEGIPAKKHGARRVKKEDVDWADHILVMERGHKTDLERLWPEVKDKTELLGSFTSEGPVPDEIVDPYGRSPYHYRLAQAQITLAISNLVKKLMQT